MSPIKVLIADDDLTFCMLVKDLLNRKGYNAQSATSVESCRNLLDTGQFDVLMQDMCFPALEDGFEMLSIAKTEHPDTIVMMISGEGNIPDAVAAIKSGASDFIEKPIEPDHLLLRLQTVVARLEMQKKISALSKTAIGMIGVSKAMNKVFDDIIVAAKYDCPVLIYGETGVGKELAARAVHRLHSNSNKEMVVINCGAIPKELVESELFGYEKGAFTGAIKQKKGYFELAEGTAVFLDEISELPLEAQVKLLRLLSEKEIQKVGGKVQKVNTRILSATNKDLRAMIQRGNFRDDLFYRLDTLSIQIPPLRERREDILPLATHFISQFCSEISKAPLTLLPQAALWLTEQAWHGNVRELRNAIYRGVVHATGGNITIANLQNREFNPGFDATRVEGNLKDAMHSYEKAFIIAALKRNSYNVSLTARELDLDRSNLFKKIKALEIEKKYFRYEEE